MLWVGALDACGGVLSRGVGRLLLPGSVFEKNAKNLRKLPKISIFSLWGHAPPPLWDTKTRDPRRFHQRTVPRVRAKFGEDPSVNKGTSLKKTGELD